MTGKAKETKVLPSQTMAFDPETGVVEAYVSIMGILDDDEPPDLIESGAFLRTITERGPGGANRIRTLWQHMWSEVIGMPVSLAEHAREALPAKILEKFPQATGGLYAKTQFVMDVQRGREALALYKAGAMDEWSIGFDTITSGWEKQNEMTYRRIKEIRLWEYSPVTWGANPGTTTTSVKNSDPAGTNQWKKLAALLGVDADLSDEDLLAEVEKRLKAGTEPSERTLTPREVAQLKARAMGIQLRLKGQ
jgi:HK97 family phage prohead protease